MSDFRLKVFCCVAKNLSYTKAAEELHITQPAITKHIHELEAQYKVRLFERMGNKIMMTHAGKVLLKHSVEILHEYSKLDFVMNLLHGTHSGNLRIGASTTIAQYVLPPLLAKFISKFPEIHISLVSGNSDEIESELINHHIDLGLIEGDKRLPNLKYTHLMDDELVAITSAKSIYAKKDEMTLEELTKIPLVLRENGSGTLSVFYTALEQHSIKPSDLNVQMQMGSSESIKLFLEHADAISIISFRCVTRELVDGGFKIIELPEMEMKRELDFMQLQGDEEGLPSLLMQFALHETER
jgi:LysR family transcriptional regulator, transcriptional activator of the cysJI operon